MEATVYISPQPILPQGNSIPSAPPLWRRAVALAILAVLLIVGSAALGAYGLDQCGDAAIACPGP